MVLGSWVFAVFTNFMEGNGWRFSQSLNPLTSNEADASLGSILNFASAS